MPKMTDYVREGFKRRRRPWDQADLPEWWGLATWVGLAGLVAAVLLAAVFDPGESSGDADAGASSRAPYPVQSINPYTPSPSESAGAGESPSPGTPSAGNTSAPPPSNDFAATAAVSIRKTGGGEAVVPAGARNVALAGAHAAATGNWTGVPYTGPDKPPQRTRTLQGKVTGELTVADPSVTGNSFYVFTAMINHELRAQPQPVQITVELGPSGYTAALRKGTGRAR